jgi:16S rRNA processing protein RimM
MAYQSNILLGQIIKTSGFEGAVIIKLEREFIENLPGMESVFIEIDGRLVPFLLSDYEYTGSDIVRLKFLDYESAEKVVEFKGCHVFLTSETPVDSTESGMDDLLDYSVHSEESGFVGRITEVIKNPGQWVLNLLSAENKEILIPFHEDLILNIDEKSKVIIMKIPEGITDLN